MIRLFDLDGLPLEIVRRLIEDAGRDQCEQPPSPTPLPAHAEDSIIARMRAPAHAMLLDEPGDGFASRCRR